MLKPEITPVSSNGISISSVMIECDEFCFVNKNLGGFSYLVTTYVATWLATVLLDGVGNLTVSLLLTVKPCSLPILITGPLFQRPSRRLQGGLVSPYAKGNRVGDTANAGWVGEN